VDLNSEVDAGQFSTISPLHECGTEWTVAVAGQSLLRLSSISNRPRGGGCDNHDFAPICSLGVIIKINESRDAVRVSVLSPSIAGLSDCTERVDRSRGFYVLRSVCVEMLQALSRGFYVLRSVCVGMLQLLNAVDKSSLEFV